MSYYSPYVSVIPMLLTSLSRTVIPQLEMAIFI